MTVTFLLIYIFSLNKHFLVLIKICFRAQGAIKQNCDRFSLSPYFCLLRRKTLSLVLIEEIGKDVSGQDKTVLTEFQITFILYKYESLGGGVIINKFLRPRLENFNKSLTAKGLLYLKTLKTSQQL